MLVSEAKLDVLLMASGFAARSWTYSRWNQLSQRISVANSDTTAPREFSTLDVLSPARYLIISQ